MVIDNTMKGLTLFNQEIKDSFIFHIPHAKTNIPAPFINDYVNQKTLIDEIFLLTDHATDEIFNIPHCDKIVFPFSRVFCDVERFTDEKEPMFKVGRGFFYTKTDSGLTLRHENNKSIVYENYYLPHHNELYELTEKKLNTIGFCTIIDCHSFSDVPFNTDLIKTPNRPDFCIGIDPIHTPKWLYENLYNFLINYNFTVGINNPYEGTIIPTKHYGNKNVISIMLEINRKLYMKNNIPIPENVKTLNLLIKEFIKKYFE